MSRLVDVHEVLVTFIPPDPSHVPANIPQKDDEAWPEQRLRMDRTTKTASDPCLPVTRRVDVSHIFLDLKRSGYLPVQVVWQSRLNADGTRFPHVLIRFKHQQYLEGWATHQDWDLLGQQLVSLAADAFWGVRCYANHLTDPQGEIVRTTFTINCEARDPRFDCNGRSRTERAKNANGQKVGDPQPIQASAVLRLMDRAFSLEPIYITVF